MRGSGFILIGILAASAAIAAPLPSAAQETYTYRVEHPIFGDIGTYTNIVHRNGDNTEVDTKLHVAVSILGIVLYRQDAHRVEQWRKDRLTAFTSDTNDDGDRIEVRGEARDGHFVITGPSGVVNAPADVHPSNPWPGNVLRDNGGTVMSTKTGALFNVRVRGGEEVAVTLDGKPMRLRQYVIVGHHNDLIWVDNRNIPVAFRTQEEGATVDLVLVQ